MCSGVDQILADEVTKLGGSLPHPHGRAGPWARSPHSACAAPRRHRTRGDAAPTSAFFTFGT